MKLSVIYLSLFILANIYIFIETIFWTKQYNFKNSEAPIPGSQKKKTNPRL